VKFILDNWYLFALALISGSLLLWPILQGATVVGLTPDAAVQLINRAKAVVIDVCESDEFATGHVVGAKNVPFNEMEKRLTAAVKNKGVPLILVCQSGARSSRAVALAKTLGYEQAQSLAGGLAAWKAANLPIERG
jgi:rhodanese-related sulfurtransferase